MMKENKTKIYMLPANLALIDFSYQIINELYYLTAQMYYSFCAVNLFDKGDFFTQSLFIFI